MATYTSKLNLKKPGQDDFYNVEDFNGNADAIDAFASRTDNPHSVTASQVKALKIYNGFSAMNAELGTNITVTTPIADIIKALPDNTGLKADIGAADTTIYPAIYGILTIYKIRANRVEVEYVSSTNSVHSEYNARWVGQYADNTFGGFIRVFTEAQPPSAEDVGALPLSGGNLTGALYFNGIGALQQFNSTVEIISRVVGSSTDDRIHFAMNADEDVDNALVLAKIINNVASTYKVFGEHNLPFASQIQSGSYVGTGVSGTANPNRLNFDFQPKLVIVICYCEDNDTYYHAEFARGTSKGAISHKKQASSFDFDIAYLTWGSNYLEWYVESSSSSNALYQLNRSNTTYNYIAIG